MKERTPTLVKKAVEVRKELTQLVPWQDEPMTLANQLAEAITSTLHTLRRFSLDPADSATESVKNSTLCADQRYDLLERILVMIEQDGVGKGNWFWENKDSIDEVAASNLFNLFAGFTYYAFQRRENVFGASFKWQIDVQLTSSSVSN
ncbi:hypothetical protein BDW69DRAFT_187499 [Aspergillus filifer]